VSRPELEPCHRQLGAKVQQMRELLGLSQEELRQRTIWTRGTIANMETGRHRFLLHHVEMLARAFGTTPKHLMRGIWL
jgi:transcriptional regulator with XRE-family HTH domain